MALSNEDKQEVKKMIREEFKKLIPEFFSRSLEQLRSYFVSNIK